jgi:hypothetical protein
MGANLDIRLDIRLAGFASSVFASSVLVVVLVLAWVRLQALPAQCQPVGVSQFVCACIHCLLQCRHAADLNSFSHVHLQHSRVAHSWLPSFLHNLPQCALCVVAAHSAHCVIPWLFIHAALMSSVHCVSWQRTVCIVSFLIFLGVVPRVARGASPCPSFLPTAMLVQW